MCLHGLGITAARQMGRPLLHSRLVVRQHPGAPATGAAAAPPARLHPDLNHHRGVVTDAARLPHMALPLSLIHI
eukprot:3270058-Prorocentrum_lima.AAC.1